MLKLVPVSIMLAALGCSPTRGVRAGLAKRASLDASIALPLATEGRRIVDGHGREVILRGVQHHALQDVDYQGREFLPEDFGLIASLGLTTLRVAFSWSRLQPQPDGYDEGYLSEIQAVLDQAHAAGLFVVLEWHQDLFGRCTQDAASPARINANGAPDWACFSDIPTSLSAHARQFDRLLMNVDGRWDDFLDAWRFVVARFAEHPALIGYDLLNEPGGSDGFEQARLFPAYRQGAAALRSAGARGLIFLDAPARRNEMLSTVTEAMADADPALVYAPHLYSGWVMLYLFQQRPSDEMKNDDFANAESEAQAFGLPWWNGEWGIHYGLESWPSLIRKHAELEDDYRVGSSYWAVNRAVPGQGDASISGGQSLFDEERVLRDDLAGYLSRPYPIASPGTLRRLRYDFDDAQLSLELEVDDTVHPLILHAPKHHLSELRCLDVQGSGYVYDFHAQSERLLVRFERTGAVELTLRACE